MSLSLAEFLPSQSLESNQPWHWTQPLLLDPQTRSPDLASWWESALAGPGPSETLQQVRFQSLTLGQEAILTPLGSQEAEYSSFGSAGSQEALESSQS